MLILTMIAATTAIVAQSHTSIYHDTICPDTRFVIHENRVDVVNVTDWDNSIGWTIDGRWGFGPHETNNRYVSDQNCQAADCYYPGCESNCTTDSYGGVTYYYTSDWCLAMTCTETPRGPSVLPPSGNGTAAFCSVYQGGTSAPTSQLISPFYDIYAPEQTSVSFQYLSESIEIVAQNITYFSTISFKYRKEGSTQWVELWNSGGGDVSNWSTYQNSLAALPGSGRYSFCFSVTGNAYVAAIDNFHIIGLQATPIPSEVLRATEGSTITTTDTVHLSTGYDSIIYTQWYIAPEAHTEIQSEHCDSVMMGGYWIYHTDDYIDSTLTTTHGCDSIVTHHLIIHFTSDTHQVDTSVCEQFTWLDNGTSYTESGVYLNHDTNQYGCDSIGVLRLAVYHSSQILTTDSACNQYTWAFNRQQYTNSNTYYDTLTNAGGCAVYGTLNLTINHCAVVDFPDNVDSTRCMMLQEASSWSIRNAWSSGGGVSNHNTPMVGDLDDDGVPEIVCFSSNGEYDNNGYIDNRILVFDGVSKQIKQNIAMPAYVTAYDASAYGLVKLANRRGLIVVACCDMYLRAFDIQSSNPNVPIWTSDQPYNTNGQYAVTVSFADFMGDGNTEIAVCNKIFDAQTGTLLATATGGACSGASFAHYSHRTGRILYTSSIANILGDDRQELILGNEIYDVNIVNYNGTNSNSLTLVKRISPPTGVVEDGHAQVADFDLDGHLDVLITNKNIAGSGGVVSMYVWDVSRNTTSQAVQIPCNMSGKSIPLIADIDGDNQLEVVIQCAASGVGNNRVRTYKYNATTNQFQFLWGFPVDEDSYSNGMTAFDFNLDGKTEMLICDQSRIRVV
ncbi:MAG: VCBS repeat-containing protein, partial [Bacteroidales bacterium]|nr:VCBS repeat-containing protein [Candidatus Colimorpha onthohippi]